MLGWVAAGAESTGEPADGAVDAAGADGWASMEGDTEGPGDEVDEARAAAASTGTIDDAGAVSTAATATDAGPVATIASTATTVHQRAGDHAVSPSRRRRGARGTNLRNLSLS